MRACEGTMVWSGREGGWSAGSQLLLLGPSCRGGEGIREPVWRGFSPGWLQGGAARVSPGASWHGVAVSPGPPAACEWERGVLKRFVVGVWAGPVTWGAACSALPRVRSHKLAAGRGGLFSGSCCCHCCLMVPISPAHFTAAPPPAIPTRNPPAAQFLKALSQSIRHPAC